MKVEYALILTSFLVRVIVVDSLTLSIETVPRKRLGKKSFIQKQERGDTHRVASPSEIQHLLLENVDRVPGSITYLKSWKNWLRMSIDAIRDDLSKDLLSPIDKEEFERLFYRLGVAADTGKMPSFSDAGARSGYALEFFCRARYLAEIYMDVYETKRKPLPQYWIDALMETPMLGSGDFDQENNQPYGVVSLGGGPG